MSEVSREITREEFEKIVKRERSPTFINTNYTNFSNVGVDGCCNGDI